MEGPPVPVDTHDDRGPKACTTGSEEDDSPPHKGNGRGDGAGDGDGDCADDENGGDSDGAVTMDISIRSALKWKHTRTALLTKFDDDLKRLREEVSSVHTSNLSADVALTLHPPEQPPPADPFILDRVLNIEAGWKLLSDCDWRLVFFGVTFFVVSISIVVILLFYKSRH